MSFGVPSGIGWWCIIRQVVAFVANAAGPSVTVDAASLARGLRVALLIGRSVSGCQEAKLGDVCPRLGEAMTDLSFPVYFSAGLASRLCRLPLTREVFSLSSLSMDLSSPFFLRRAHLSRLAGKVEARVC